MLLLRNVRNIDALLEEQQHLDQIVAKLGKRLYRVYEQAENQPGHNPDLKRFLRNFGDEIGNLLLALGAIAPADIDRLVVDLTARKRRGFGEL